MDQIVQLASFAVVAIGGVITTVKLLIPMFNGLREFGRKLDEIEEERKWVRREIEPNGMAQVARTQNLTQRDVTDQTLIEVREIRKLLIDHMGNPRAHGGGR